MRSSWRRALTRGADGWTSKAGRAARAHTHTQQAPCVTPAQNAQGVMRYEGGCGPLTALTVSAEQCIVAGTASGALLVFAPDPRRRLTRRVPLPAARAGPRATNSSPAKAVRFNA